MNNVTIIPPSKPREHSCYRTLPASKNGYGETTHVLGTLLVCSCGHGWVVDTWWNGEQRINVWRGLYWTERKLRRRVREVRKDRQSPTFGDPRFQTFLPGAPGSGGSLEE